MSTNNFNFKNICVVVSDDDYYDGYVEDSAEFLKEKIKGVEVQVPAKWLGNDSRVLGYVDFEKSNGEHYARIYVTLNSGYYADACLDYVVERESDYGYIEVSKSIETKIDSKCRAIAKALRTMGQEVIKVAQFSNGEAMYKAIKRK